GAKSCGAAIRSASSGCTGVIATGSTITRSSLCRTATMCRGRSTSWKAQPIRRRSSYQTPPHSAEHEFRRAVQIELLHHPPAVRLDRVQAQIQPVGDILVAVAFGQKLVDLALALGQEFVAIGSVAHLGQAAVTFLEYARHRRREVRIAALDLLDGVHQFVSGGVLEDVAAG